MEKSAFFKISIVFTRKAIIRCFWGREKFLTQKNFFYVSTKRMPNIGDVLQIVVEIDMGEATCTQTVLHQNRLSMLSKNKK